MKLNKKDKIKLTKELAAKLKEENTFLITNFEGLKSKESNELRLKLIKEGVHFKALKKTMISILLKRAKLAGFEIQQEKGQMGLAMGEDGVKLAKLINNFGRTKNKDMIIAGFLEGEFLSKERVMVLAKLPSLEIMRAQFIGMLKSSMAGLVGVLSGNQRKLVYTLKAIQDRI